MPLHDTRGAASATGFGFGASTGGTDWSKYAIVPYNTADANPNTIAFLNVPTNTVDYYVTMPTTTSNCVLRMGNYLVVGLNCSFWVIDIKTNTTVQSQTTPFGFQTTGDFFKFAEDKFGIITKIGTEFQIVTLQMNVNGTTTPIALNSSVATWGAQTGYNSPMGAAIVTCDSKGMFQSFSGRVAFRSIYSYAGSTVTINGNVSISANGTSISLYNGEQNYENFSRPSASSGGLGGSIIYDMDHSSYYISTGTETTMTGFTASGSGTPTNFRGCGVTQSQAFLNMGWNGASSGYIRRMIASAATTPLNYSVLSGDYFYGTMQMYGDGAFFAYNAASATAVYRTYSSITDTFSSEIVPSGINGYINKNGVVYGTYNY